MKQIIKYSVLLLAAVYILQVAGINVSIHYCGNKVYSISFFNHNTSKKCKCSSKKMKANCCKDKKAQIKLTSSQQKPNKFNQSNTLTKTISKDFVSEYLFDFYNISLKPQKKYNSKPPDDVSRPVYLLNRVFLI